MIACEKELEQIRMQLNYLRRGQYPPKSSDIDTNRIKRNGGPVSKHAKVIGQETNNHDKDNEINKIAGLQSIENMIKNTLNPNSKTRKDHRDSMLDNKDTIPKEKTSSTLYDYYDKFMKNINNSQGLIVKTDWKKVYENTQKTTKIIGKTILDTMDKTMKSIASKSKDEWQDIANTHISNIKKELKKIEKKFRED